jgi:hypothetical protein
MPDLPPDDTLTDIDLDWPLIETPITSYTIPSEPDNIPDEPNSIILSRTFKLTEFTHEFDNETSQHVLDKRYTTCSSPALTYDNLYYPSTASSWNANPPPAGSADLIPAIPKWVDFQSGSGIFGACPWSLVLFPNRQGGQEYASKCAP